MLSSFRTVSKLAALIASAPFVQQKLLNPPRIALNHSLRRKEHFRSNFFFQTARSGDSVDSPNSRVFISPKVISPNKIS